MKIIIVANFNSSNDTTPNVAQKISNDYSFVRYLAIPKKGNMGWDMKMGLNAAVGEYLRSN
jgi:glycosyltransferase involved in cell wall biosynthesis